MDRPADIRGMQLALMEGGKCSSPSFYAVGCVIVSADGRVLSKGHTGQETFEFEGRLAGRHAEEVALSRLPLYQDLSRATLYSTLEPCSERKSSDKSCTALILQSGIRRVVFGTHEPFNPALGIICRGEILLKEAGIETLWLEEMDSECSAAVHSQRT